MKNLLTIFIFSILVTFSSLVFSQEIYDKVTSAIKSGNAKELSALFDNNIEITILDKEQTYSKAQAEQVVKDFFAKNSPKSFELVHKGSSNEGSKYGIGTLITASRTYRVYFLIKQKTPNAIVQELRFENE